MLMTKLALLILSGLLFILKEIFAQEKNSFGLMFENYITWFFFFFLSWLWILNFGRVRKQIQLENKVTNNEQQNQITNPDQN